MRSFTGSSRISAIEILFMLDIVTPFRKHVNTRKAGLFINQAADSSEA
jgi:hypothetical protein